MVMFYTCQKFNLIFTLLEPIITLINMKTILRLIPLEVLTNNISPKFWNLVPELLTPLNSTRIKIWFKN